MFDAKFAERFQFLCEWMYKKKKQDNTPYLRRTIVRGSNGLCPAKFLVSVDDGCIYPERDLCNKDTYAQVNGQHNLVDVHDDLGDDTRELEVKWATFTECAIGKPQAQYLAKLAETYKNDCNGFRKSLLKSKRVRVVAIHVCRWDGSPRTSVSEIQEAICLYPSTPARMDVVLRAFLKDMFGTYCVLHFRYRQASIHIIGENHSKPLRFHFLSNFLRKLKSETDARESIILVEQRPWNDMHHDADIRNDIADIGIPMHDKDALAEYLTQVERNRAPLNFFSQVLFLCKGKDVLPNHRIVPYDYRYDDLDEMVKLLKQPDLTSRIRRNIACKDYISESSILAADVNLESLLPSRKGIEMILESQLVKLKAAPGEEGRCMRREFARKIRSLKRNLFSPSIGQQEANKIVNDLLLFWISIPERTLLAHIRLSSGWYRNMYVFMGSGHIESTVRFLHESLGAVKTGETSLYDASKEFWEVARRR